MPSEKSDQEAMQVEGARSADEAKTTEELLGALLTVLRGLRQAKLDPVQVALLVELLAAGASVLAHHATGVKAVPYQTGEADMRRGVQSALVTVHGWTVRAVCALDPRLSSILSAVPGAFALPLIHGDYEPPLSAEQALRAQAEFDGEQE